MSSIVFLILLNFLKISNFVENSTNLTFNALQNIKKIVGQNVKIYKEKKFIINASPYEIFGEGVKQKVLIQGIIDFFAIGEKVILIDYKYSLIKDDISTNPYPLSISTLFIVK